MQSRQMIARGARFLVLTFVTLAVLAPGARAKSFEDKMKDEEEKADDAIKKRLDKDRANLETLWTFNLGTATSATVKTQQTLASTDLFHLDSDLKRLRVLRRHAEEKRNRCKTRYADNASEQETCKDTYEKIKAKYDHAIEKELELKAKMVKHQAALESKASQLRAAALQQQSASAGMSCSSDAFGNQSCEPAHPPLADSGHIFHEECGVDAQGAKSCQYVTGAGTDPNNVFTDACQYNDAGLQVCHMVHTRAPADDGHCGVDAQGNAYCEATAPSPPASPAPPADNVSQSQPNWAPPVQSTGGN